MEYFLRRYLHLTEEEMRTYPLAKGYRMARRIILEQITNNPTVIVKMLMESLNTVAVSNPPRNSDSLHIIQVPGQKRQKFIFPQSWHVPEGN
jgi:hypothetical protein